MTIADNGTSIPTSIIDKIFDPFFTTKSVEKGSGQGLSLCHRIICGRHHGKIKVSSQPGSGTEFKIYLPKKPNRKHRAEDQQ
ncbi:ATP-binding protein [Halioxenophilus sp. WMMB6]|uniref:ATP-binding protein n=1 Tax=Halioxenophilus sp. WMMB6 TaxID=3073815 RepID=UPI00398BC6E3